MKSRSPEPGSQAVKKRRGWIALLLWAVLATLIIRLFIFDSLFISKDFTRDELQRGDRVLISKLHFGPRLPVTPLHIPFTGNYLPWGDHQRSYLAKPELRGIRLTGITRIRHNDLVAFNCPDGDSVVRGSEGLSYYALRRQELASDDPGKAMPTPEYGPLDRREAGVSRCKGLPGDTIQITQGRLYVNGSLEGFIQKTSHNHLVEKLMEDSLLNVLSDRYGFIRQEVAFYPGLGCLIPLRSGQRIELQQELMVAIDPVLLGPGQGDYNTFPHDYRFPWNRDHFGPLIIPGRGDSVRLTLLNLPLYERIIRVYENNELEAKGEEIRINGISSKYYTFRQNYYFVIGDNRHHSRDSRHWGFLPEDHITGKPILIWFSGKRDTNKTIRILWKRMLRVPA